MSTYKKKNINVQCSAFNSDHSLVAIGTLTGLLVYAVQKVELLFETEILGGVGLIDIFGHSNHLAIRGVDTLNFDERNKVQIFDAKSKQITNQVSFEVEVKNIRITKDYLIVAGTSKIHVFSKIDQQLHFLWDSSYCSNPFGAFDVAFHQDQTHICMPIEVREFPDKGIVAFRPLDVVTPPKLIRAFKETIDHIKLDRELKRKRTLDTCTEKRQPWASEKYKFLPKQQIHAALWAFWRLRNFQHIWPVEVGLHAAQHKSNEWSFAGYRSSNGLPLVGYFATDSRFCIFSYGGLYQQFEFDILHGGECFLKAKVSDYLAQSKDLIQQEKSSQPRPQNVVPSPSVPLNTSTS